MSQAIASGMLDPQDPRVKAKSMELFHLPRELDNLYGDQKVQWEEIEQMKNTMQPIQPELIVDNDAVHIDICRQWLNSDEGRDPQNMQIRQVIKMHMQAHVMNQIRMQQMQAMAQGSGQQAGDAAAGGASGGSGGPSGKQPEGKQAGKQGGQIPANPQVRQQRAEKGQAARPHKPQPPSGNGAGVRRMTQ
jgi:hypothetical protein